MRKFIVPAAALAGLLATAGAFAQDTQPQRGGTTQMAPMQGMPMQGQAQGQGGMTMGGCPMMQRSAAMEERLRRLEERMGVPTPPTPPAQPGSPG
jgi:hypothetical protein